MMSDTNALALLARSEAGTEELMFGFDGRITSLAEVDRDAAVAVPEVPGGWITSLAEVDSRSRPAHLAHPFSPPPPERRIWLEALPSAPSGMPLEPDACWFAFNDTDFLGLCLDEGGIAIDVSREWPDLVMELHVVAKGDLLAASIPRWPIRIPLQKWDDSTGIVEKFPGDTLVYASSLVLTVTADAGPEKVRVEFPAAARIGARDQIGNIVSQNLPGVPLSALPAAPAGVPVEAGTACFELDRTSLAFERVLKFGDIALYISVDWPRLAVGLWALGVDEPDAVVDRPRKAYAKVPYWYSLNRADQAIQRDPNDAQAIFERGLEYAARNDLDRAIADLSEAVRLAPADLFRRSFRANTWDRMGRHDLAIADYDHVLRLDPYDDYARLCRGQSWDSLGQHARAISDFGEVIARSQGDNSHTRDALVGRALAMASIGQPEAGLADCNAALQIFPGEGSVLAGRGLIYLRMGLYEQAMADCDAAVSCLPEAAEPLFGRGVARHHLGDAAGGAADIAAATALDKTVADRLARRGIKP
jgi:tetratricopeptide (TPR) repeat protein